MNPGAWVWGRGAGGGEGLSEGERGKQQQQKYFESPSVRECVYVIVCFFAYLERSEGRLTHAHTHRRVWKGVTKGIKTSNQDLATGVCVCVCVCLCLCVRACVCVCVYVLTQLCLCHRAQDEA